MARSPALKAVPDGIIDLARDIRDCVQEIIPGGRDPTRSYHARLDALRGLDRIIGDRD